MAGCILDLRLDGTTSTYGGWRMDVNVPINIRGKSTGGEPSAWEFGGGGGSNHPSNIMVLNLIILIKSALLCVLDLRVFEKELRRVSEPRRGEEKLRNRAFHYLNSSSNNICMIKSRRIRRNMHLRYEKRIKNFCWKNLMVITT
jgi:hypothetical protein